VPNGLNQKDEFKPSFTQILRLMYEEESDLALMIRETYMKDPKAQKFLSDLKISKKVKGGMLPHERGA